MFTAFRPFRPFDVFRVPLGGKPAPVDPDDPEATPEIEFVTSEGDLFFTSDGEQLVVQEA
jgi:hypothetical protein